MTEDIKIKLLDLAIQILKSENKKLTVENVMATYSQLAFKLYMPIGI